MSAAKRRRKAIERRNAWLCQCGRPLTTRNDIETGRCLACYLASVTPSAALEPAQ
jgi:hypothetical protein